MTWPACPCWQATQRAAVGAPGRTVAAVAGGPQAAWSSRFIHLVSVEAHLCDLEDRLNKRRIFSGNPMTDSPAREGDGAHDQTLKISDQP